MTTDVDECPIEIQTVVGGEYRDMQLWKITCAKCSRSDKHYSREKSPSAIQWFKNDCPYRKPKPRKKGEKQ